MVKTQIFPEIHHYTKFLAKDEREVFEVNAQRFSNNTLNEQFIRYLAFSIGKATLQSISI